MKLRWFGLYFHDSKMENVFQAFQIEQHVKNFNVCFLISVFATVYSLIISIKTGRDSDWNTYNAFRIGYVLIAFSIGRLYKKSVQYPFLILELLNLYAVMRFFNEQISGQRGFEIAIKKTVLTFTCLFPTYNFLLKSLIFLVGAIYVNIKLYGFQISWRDDMSWNIYLYISCLFICFYNEEKFRRILFRRYYNELENLRRWKFISEKFIPTGFIIVSTDLLSKEKCPSPLNPPIKTLYFNDFFKETLAIKDPNDIISLIRNMPIYDPSPFLEKFKRPSNEEATLDLESLLKKVLKFDNPGLERAFGKKSHDELNIGHFSSRMKLKYENGGIEEKNYHVSLFEFREEEEPCVLIIVKDLTEQKRNENLVALHNYKDLLMASVSHELKTPLNSIIGTTSFLQHRSIADQEVIEGLKQIRTSSDFLLHEINDILDFSQIAKGKLRLNSYEFRLESILDEISHLFEINFKEKGLSLRREIELEDIIIVSDAVRLKQVLINLIGNALKFTFKGGITIKVRGDEADKLLISVEDSGLGMREDIRNSLFQVYGTFDDPTCPINRNGTGLGLVISKQLVGKIGPYENIEVSSVLGRGSEFSFKIYRDLRPYLNKVNESQERVSSHFLEIKSKREKEVPAPLSIDIEEDKLTEENARGVVQKLKKGLRIIWNKLVKPDSNYIPIIKNDKIQRKTPLLTEVVLEKQQEIGSTISNKSSLPERIPDDHNVPFNDNPIPLKFIPSLVTSKNLGFRFLLVDDTPFNLLILEKFIRNIFGGEDAICTKAFDGIDAIEAVEQFKSGGEQFNIIFMDCNMTRMDGFEATKILKKRMKEGELMYCPILGVTADSSYQAQKQMFESGMDDYITKPMTQEVFAKLIKQWLGAEGFL